MEIKQGYTLSQFVDYIDKNIEYSTEALQYIVNYNELYKQPLHKGQFIPCDDEGNEIEKPQKEQYKEYNHDVAYFDSEEYDKDWLTWKEAEKKVIFKGFIDDVGYFVPYNEVSRQDLKYWLLNEFTLGDIFEATNGQLETQNINI